MKNISILGATGSIGTQTLDVIRNSCGEINLIGITANSSVDKIKEILIIYIFTHTYYCFFVTDIMYHYYIRSIRLLCCILVS